MPRSKDNNAGFIAEHFGFRGAVHEVYAEDVMIGEKTFMEIGRIAGELAKEDSSFPTTNLFTRLLGDLNERFYLHDESEDLVLQVELGEHAHYILIPPGFWTWSEKARPEPAGMFC
jgi:hypothetical protein